MHNFHGIFWKQKCPSMAMTELGEQNADTFYPNHTTFYPNTDDFTALEEILGLKQIHYFIYYKLYKYQPTFFNYIYSVRCFIITMHQSMGLPQAGRVPNLPTGFDIYATNFPQCNHQILWVSLTPSTWGKPLTGALKLLTFELRTVTCKYITY